MRLAEAQRKAVSEIKEILDNAGLVNARTAKKNDLKIRYYYNRGETITADGTETLVIYGIASMTGTGRADSENFGYVTDIAIDIFTHQDGQSKKILDLIETIENEAMKKGYYMDMNSQETFDGTRVVQRLSYTLSKTVY